MSAIESRSGAKAPTYLLGKLKRGASIERMDYGFFRLFYKDGKRGRRVFESEMQWLQEHAAIVRTDDRTSKIGEAWGLNPAFSPGEAK